MTLEEACPEHAAWLGVADEPAAVLRCSAFVDGLHWRVEIAEVAFVARGYERGVLRQEVAVDGLDRHSRPPIPNPDFIDGLYLTVHLLSVSYRYRDVEPLAQPESLLRPRGFLYRLPLGSIALHPNAAGMPRTASLATANFVALLTVGDVASTTTGSRVTSWRRTSGDSATVVLDGWAQSTGGVATVISRSDADGS